MSSHRPRVKHRFHHNVNDYNEITYCNQDCKETFYYTVYKYFINLKMLVFVQQ